MFNHPLYCPDIAPNDFHLFLHLKKFLSGQRQHFQDDREAELSVTVVPTPGSGFYDTEHKSRSNGMTNVSFKEASMLKNSLIFAVSVPINLSIKLAFDSVNGYREIYFVDVLRITIKNIT